MDVETLAALVAQGNRPKFLHFWRHTPRVPGQLDASCLSQWYPAPFVEGDDAYPTAEHFMMAEKARLFEDLETRGRVLSCRTAADAKKLGRTVKGFDDHLWEAARFEVVVRANLAKFSQNSSLQDFLLGTGHRVLVEASPVDVIWGIGLAANDPMALNPRQWKGLNLLGFALMEVRAKLVAS